MDRREVKIGMPCTLDWRKMTPAEGGRFCGDCKKVVRDLSSMTEREARTLLKRESGGELCVRYIYDNQGRIFFGDNAPRPDPTLLPPTFLSRARRVAVAAAAVALPFATQACDLITAQEQEAQPEYHEMMGGAMPSDDHVIAQQQPDAGADADAASPSPKTDASKADATPNQDQDQDQDPDGGADAEPPIN